MSRVLALPLILVVAIAFAGPSLASAETTGMTVEQALRTGAEAGGAVYAGDCGRTRSPQDIGKTCSKLVEERGPVRAYLAGQTFSEFRRWLFLEYTPDGWEIIAAAPLDSHAAANAIPWPAVGTGG